MGIGTQINCNTSRIFRGYTKLCRDKCGVNSYPLNKSRLSIRAMLQKMTRPDTRSTLFQVVAFSMHKNSFSHVEIVICSAEYDILSLHDGRPFSKNSIKLKTKTRTTPPMQLIRQKSLREELQFQTCLRTKVMINRSTNGPTLRHKRNHFKC